MKTNKKIACIAAIWCLPLPLAAQTDAAITMDEEPHHHLVLQNGLVKVFEVELPPRDAFLMHRHDTDDVAVLLGAATTVSTAPGQADVLTMTKPGEVVFARSGRVHSVRNIGQTAYLMVAIDLLKPQTGARNLCGAQVRDTKPDCPSSASPDSNARSDVPQFETDQIRVTLARVPPRQEASFGETSRDNLIVLVDDGAISFSVGHSGDQILARGSPVWIARGAAKQLLKNNGNNDLRVVTVAFKPQN